MSWASVIRRACIILFNILISARARYRTMPQTQALVQRGLLSNRDGNPLQPDCLHASRDQLAAQSHISSKTAGLAWSGWRRLLRDPDCTTGEPFRVYSTIPCPSLSARYVVPNRPPPTSTLRKLTCKQEVKVSTHATYSIT
jgi:hypothetical protein